MKPVVFAHRKRPLGRGGRALLKQLTGLIRKGVLHGASVMPRG